MAATLVLGTVFLGVKAVEYTTKYHDGLIPFAGMFQPTENVHFPPEVSIKNIQMFYWIYFAMTGLHALHMIIGIGFF